MRVIAGTARGRLLNAPQGMTTRPMMDVVKGSLFNILESNWGIGDRVLDLYAGSGSLGIEALSRGASHADFIEQGREACKVIGDNLSRLGFDRQAHVIQGPVEQSVNVDRLPCPQPPVSGENRYDLVFVDAPYRAEVTQVILMRLTVWPHLTADALICVGHHKQESVPDYVGIWRRIKQRCFGASCISILEKIGLEQL
ncbi:MAG: 16S rRNA (guanine(966)-N(2))-methyltransferase RsmD [Chloroflexi bacterium]|nr:16S rRNA (guanine(966)-N(2))-methyltransferase RsmD [Chloroflexota bacterium]